MDFGVQWYGLRRKKSKNFDYKYCSINISKKIIKIYDFLKSIMVKNGMILRHEKVSG